jgi:hypothetical protein
VLFVVVLVCFSFGTSGTPATHSPFIPPIYPSERPRSPGDDDDDDDDDEHEHEHEDDDEHEHG